MISRSLAFSFTAAVLFAGSLSAAPRTVCVRLVIADSRFNCSTAAETGALRPCNAGGYADAVGHQIEVWDKDGGDGSGDDYIGTWYLAGGGTQCVEFEWENASYSHGEAHPDVYIRYINMVNRTGYSNYIRVKAVQRGGGDHPITTWRNGQPGDPDRYVARNCQPGVTSFIFPAGSLVPTNDRASSRANWIMALDSSQHTLQVFGESMDRHVNLHFPGRTDCPTSCTISRTEFHMFSTQGNDGVRVAHEMGHVIQMQEFNQDELRNECGGGWTLTSSETDSCATTEGFATYVGVVSWYEPNNVATAPIGFGMNTENATPQSAVCANNRGIAVQVAKAFWDMDDWNNEAGAGAAAAFDDTMSVGSTALVRGWRQFPDGGGNREDFECDDHGVNMRDYFANNDHRFSTGFFETFIQHNCLTSQTDG